MRYILRQHFTVILCVHVCRVHLLSMTDELASEGLRYHWCIFRTHYHCQYLGQLKRVTYTTGIRKSATVEYAGAHFSVDLTTSSISLYTIVTLIVCLWNPLVTSLWPVSSGYFMPWLLPCWKLSNSGPLLKCSGWLRTKKQMAATAVKRERGSTAGTTRRTVTVKWTRSC